MSVASPTRAPIRAAPLVFRREGLAHGAVAGGAFGGRLVGNVPGVPGMPGSLHAELLAPAGAVFDAWGGGTAAHGRHGCVQFASDGHWLFGHIEIDDAPSGLQAAAQRAYGDLFEVLALGACPHLLRVWNYLADINGESGGVERYRQFNAGRQQAFVDARHSAFDGAPAACALGTRGGPLTVQFLAGRRAPVAIENPRQVSAYRYPAAYGARSPTFSRAALADLGGQRQALFVSGTASIVGHETVHRGDVRRQTEESLRNIATLRGLAAERAGQPFAAGELTYTAYLRHAADLSTVREVFEREVGAASRAAREAIYLRADICRADLLVEIEAHGFAGAGEHA